jgi:hypothetical protein
MAERSESVDATRGGTTIAGARHEILGQVGGGGANRGDPDLLDDVEPPQLRMNRGQRRRSLFEPPGAIVPDERGRIELELPRVGKPARDGRCEASDEFPARVQERDSWPAQEPPRSHGAQEVHAARATSTGTCPTPW